MNDLDKIFADFSSRKQTEDDAKKAKRLEEYEAREATLEVLTTIVLPVVQELSASIIAKGHKATVKEKFDNYTYPSVELKFLPVSPTNPNAAYAESILDFTHTDFGKIEVSQKIRSANGREVSIYLPDGTWGLSTVNRDKVQTRALEFVQAALGAN